MVISFIVEAFLLHLEETSHRKERAGQVEEDADCIEGGSHADIASL